MRYLIVSDLHSNWEALEGALAAVEGRYDTIVCCGDIVGYGADPNRCTEWVRDSCQAVVRGNHDKACCGLSDASDFNKSAKAAARWTQAHLTPANLAYLRDLPIGPHPVVPAGGDGQFFDLVHGSPYHEDEYLIAEAEAQRSMPLARCAVTFFGHTHLQGGFFGRRRVVRSMRPHYGPGIGVRYLELEERFTYLLNPGSIGQPRDGDPRAALVIYHPLDRYAEYWRIPYDIEGAQRKINSAGLPPVLAHRLSLGK